MARKISYGKPCYQTYQNTQNSLKSGLVFDANFEHPTCKGKSFTPLCCYSCLIADLAVLKWNTVCIFCSILAPCLKAFALTGRDCSNAWYPGCRFACPGLCATLGFQPALAKSETWVCYHFVMVRKDRCAKVNVSWRFFFIRNYYLRILCFMFHFLSLMCWFSIIIRGETYSFDVSFYVSCFILCIMFHFSKYWGSDLPLPLCFWIAPSVFLNLSLSVF